MDDSSIVALYHQRSEAAIDETAKKYERYLMAIAYSILADNADSQESGNDTYLAAWNSIPPHAPAVLRTYLGKLTRRIAIDLYRRKHRQKRQDSEYALSLEELDGCFSTGDTTVAAMDGKLLSEAINRYLRTLSQDARNLFIGRYFFLDSVAAAAAYCGMTEGKAKTLLYRTRLGLRAYLKKEGFIL